MRILYATSTFPLARDDGTPRFVEELAAAVAKHAAVTVLAPGAPGAPARERRGELEVRRFDYFRPRSLQRLAYGSGMPDNLRASAWARLQVPGFLACEARALSALQREVGADLVHSHWLLPQGVATALARGRTRRFAHVTTLHGSDAHWLSRLPGGRALARFACARSDAVIAVAASLRDRLDDALGRPSGAVLLPVGVDARRFASAPDEAVPAPFPGGFLLFTGRLVAIKGVDVLLRALPRVRARHPGLGLIVLGEGPLRASLEDTARGLGLAPWVRFAGRAGPASVAAHLRACRAAVVPSRVDRDGRAEGMPAVVLEALAAGARLVATAAGGVVDVVRPGREGWLARAGDAPDLARTILAALDAAPPPGARATAVRLDWSRVAERHLALYERALRSPSP